MLLPIIYNKMLFLMYFILILRAYLYLYTEKNVFYGKEMINRLKIVLAEEQKAVSGWQNN